MKTTIAASFLICVALLSLEAVAQSPITVTLLPGETTQTLRAPSSGSFDVRYIASEEYVCNLPTADRINNALMTAAFAGRLQQELTSLEALGTASAVSIAQAFARVAQEGTSLRSAAFSSATATILPSRLGGTGFTYTFAANCLTVPEARAGINDLRRIIRAYLGLPAPAN